ncbi:WUSCHEL-related homeobox 9 [Punica granatum]|uniref:WUSCHEL-related homeobox 9 n=1 Tax=Punica granatum TaxID=22663 RepID=A0A6P8DGF6_PUNGR|nr:WUSCHEL-related homeobox 9 [Punica granatum]
MASSNRHWPSMFKSKPHQWQHEVNSSLMSSGCHRSQYSSGCEERTPEPKPRWNPKPEQIRILEAIFDSGMVNPPRDEIRKIRAQLQEYGQVGDANVFYWFQNRKSRSKHKLRHLQNSNKQQNRQSAAAAAASASPTSSATNASAAPTSSSSSSDNKSSPKDNGAGAPNKSSASTIFSLGPSSMIDASNNSPSYSSSQQAPYFPTQEEILTEPFLFPSSHGFQLSEPQVPFHGQPMVGHYGSLLLSEIVAHGGASKKVKMNPNANATSSAHTAVPSTATANATVTVPFLSSLDQVHGAGVQLTGEPRPAGDSPVTAGSGGGVPKLTVFINDVPFELPAEPFSVQAAFGDDAVLINAAGQPILTDEWGLTLQPLQHGAFYYLI